jgi:asparagine synthase (glutamine-hydrolysing)
MCGIIGFASSKKIEGKKWLSIGRDAMIHRGPDDSGEWWSVDGKIGFGHRRLSIIDLSNAGHQPMQDKSKKITIVFNGEIYNYLELKEELKLKGYIYSTDSDTEVLLTAWQEWGEECVSHLNGMFAFAIHDENKELIFLARDRAGEKPLFYSVINGELRFSSELKGLLVDPSFPHTIDYESMGCYLSMGYIPGNMCILDGVNKLPPAHIMTFNYNTGELEVSRYWKLPEVNNQDNINEEKLLDELEFLMEDSVRKQLVADVPVGVLLSGGIDSSLMTALASRVSNNVKTFTVAFPEYGKYDESPHARAIAENFNTEHVELEANDIDIEILYKLAKQYDEPMGDSSMLPTYLVSSQVKEYCTVALGGDGGDELFGGYNHYNRLLWTQKIVSKVPIIFRKIISKFAMMILPVGFKGRAGLLSLGTNFDSELPLTSAFFDSNTRKKLLSKQKTKVKKVIKNKAYSTSDFLQRITRAEFNNYMPEDILVKIDRASMLNSLELRSPFLDYRIIEFAFEKVPSYLKATINQRKIILKKMSERLLPPEFDKQRKQGFSIPLKEWLKDGPWRDLFYQVLLADDCFFDKKTVNSLLLGQDKGRNNSERLFSLVLFEIWRREYRIS